MSASTMRPPIATVDLRRGGKITSLIGAGVEWLLQPSGRSPTDDSFVGVGLAGWDECIPTITACSSNGKLVPDHGSVWSLPWQLGDDGFASVGTDDFLFRRRLTTEGDALLIEYAVHSRAAVTTPILWAAHPQFEAPAGTRVELDVPVDVVQQVHPEPVPVREWHLVDSIGSVVAGESRKVYLRLRDRVSGARVVRPDGRWLAFAWDPALVPHLGIWFDAADFAHRPVIAVEPAIGWYDDLSLATANGTAMLLEPGETRTWRLTLTAGSGSANLAGASASGKPAA